MSWKESNLRMIVSKTTAITSLRQLKNDFSYFLFQPQIPLRLPCYDFTPVSNFKIGALLNRDEKTKILSIVRDFEVFYLLKPLQSKLNPSV